jgi:hypothetical protein
LAQLRSGEFDPIEAVGVRPREGNLRAIPSDCRRQTGRPQILIVCTAKDVRRGLRPHRALRFWVFHCESSKRPLPQCEEEYQCMGGRSYDDGTRPERRHRLVWHGWPVWFPHGVTGERRSNHHYKNGPDPLCSARMRVIPSYSVASLFFSHRSTFDPVESFVGEVRAFLNHYTRAQSPRSIIVPQNFEAFIVSESSCLLIKVSFI